MCYVVRAGRHPLLSRKTPSSPCTSIVICAAYHHPYHNLKIITEALAGCPSWTLYNNFQNATTEASMKCQYLGCSMYTSHVFSVGRMPCKFTFNNACYKTHPSICRWYLWTSIAMIFHVFIAWESVFTQQTRKSASRIKIRCSHTQYTIIPSIKFVLWYTNQVPFYRRYIHLCSCKKSPSTRGLPVGIPSNIMCYWKEMHIEPSYMYHFLHVQGATRAVRTAGRGISWYFTWNAFTRWKVSTRSPSAAPWLPSPRHMSSQNENLHIHAGTQLSESKHMQR